MDKFQEAMMLSVDVEVMSKKASVLADSFKVSILDPDIANEIRMHGALCKLADDLRNAAIAYDDIACKG